MSRAWVTSFQEHDTKLLLWWVDPKDTNREPVRNALIKHLRTRGFRIGADPCIRKHYPAISRDHHRGAKGALELKVRLSGRLLEIEFFQNVVFSNPAGGHCDFDRRQKMPYLVGKQYELERDKIAELFAGMGLPRLTLDIRRRGWAFIDNKRAELEAFQGAGFYAREIPRYNKLTATKAELAHGDVVYFFGRHSGSGGSIHKGVAFPNINNMWWVLLPGDEWANLASFHLYHRADFGTTLPRRMIPLVTCIARIRRKLDAAVNAQQFERAIDLRDALQRLQPPTAPEAQARAA
ncbi:MAG TPA: UvrB/UvrC motif-containing protein [Dokdonella sp.]|nr:UvrB/UvrC motif-containing protein [Dokdonella sp.]